MAISGFVDYLPTSARIFVDVQQSVSLIISTSIFKFIIMGSCCSNPNQPQNAHKVTDDVPFVTDVPAVIVADPEIADDKKVSEPPLIIKTTYNTLIEILLIKRILINSPDPIGKNDISSHLGDRTKEMQQLCKKVLSLVSKHSIHKFFQYHYKDKYCQAIEIMLTDIIMTHHTSEYTNQITLSHSDYTDDDTDDDDNDDDNDNKENLSNGSGDDIDNGIMIKNINGKYTRILFNQKDLVPQIFQYLELKDVNNCSKVSFIWLIHAFDINSLYYIQLSKRYNYDRYQSRVWQRLINVRKLVYENISNKLNYDTKTDTYFLTYFQSLQNIEIIRCKFGNFTDGDVSFLNVLSQKSNKIKRFHASSSSSSTLISTVEESINRVALKLPNAQKIVLSKLGLPLVLSNSCHSLSLESVSISPIMRDALINDCDLSGIKKLVLQNITFGNKVESESESTEEIAKSLAQKLCNVEKIEILGARGDTLLFLQRSILFSPIAAEEKEVKEEKAENTMRNVIVSFNFSVAEPFGIRRKQDYSPSNESNYWQNTVIPFIIKNKIKISDAKFLLNVSSLKVADKVFISNKICENIEILKIYGKTKRIGSLSTLATFVDKYFKDLLIENITFNSLMCFSINLRLKEMQDWVRIAIILSSKFNRIHNVNLKKTKTHASKEILYHLILKMQWSSGGCLKMSDYIKTLWQQIYAQFIQFGRPIDLHISLRSAYPSDHEPMAQIYNDSGSQGYKQAFLKCFGDLAADGMDASRLMSNYSKDYQIPKENKYCNPLKRPEIWCKCHKETNKDGRIVCKIDFCVKNAVYQRWKFDYN